MLLCHVAWSIPGVSIGAYRDPEIKSSGNPNARMMACSWGRELPRSGLVQRPLCYSRDGPHVSYRPFAHDLYYADDDFVVADRVSQLAGGVKPTQVALA
jgi:hypothetical protein